MKRGLGTAPSPDRLHEVARRVSVRLAADGVPHALVGGLAVAAHGYARATTDVDFLVPRSSMRKLMRLPEVVRFTELVDGVRVDLIAATEGDEAFLEQAIKEAKGTPPVLPLAALIFTKVETGRRRDQGDVVELVKRGVVDLVMTRRLLARAGNPGLTAAFEALVRAADSEPA